MMKQTRLDQLSDGIFAIVMTLLVLEIRVPVIEGALTNQGVFDAFVSVMPLFLSYLLSFMLLFTYWRGHHHIASVLAKNIDNTFSTINAFFFLFVGLVPFTTLLLGRYHTTQAAIFIYGIHIIIIGLLLYMMRQYVIGSPTIRNLEMSPSETQHGTVRILFPVYTAAIAILVSFWNTEASLLLFTVAILFNISRKSTTLFEHIVPVAKEG
ncbi:MAG: DUF1211 domain-containing protein [Candidatus Pacebacteria bacterium]|nr:DUF1211 domain-containing protein [Candidatus Paceibacterota bacterium]